MPQFGTTPTSTTVLSTNQFPVSAAWVPNSNTQGNLTAIEGLAVNTDTNGFQSTAIRLGLKDGDDATQGLTTDAAVTGDVAGTISAKLRGLNKIFAQLQFDGSNFLKINVAAGTVAATQSGTWNINNISGSISLPTGAAQDTTVAKLNIAQSTALGSSTGPMVQASVTTSAPTYTTGNINPLSLTTAGALRTDSSATTQPISAASLPLPSGAATSAKQPALGTAGTASSDVLTVQGITSMTPIAVSGTFWQATQPVSGSGNFTVVQATASSLNAQVVGAAASGSSNTGNPVKSGAVYNSTQPTVTTGQAVDNQATARGALIVATGVDAFAVNASQSGTWNINNISGTVSLPTGAATSAKQPALGTAGSASSDVLTVQGIASMTPLTVSGTVTSNQGGTWTVATNADTTIGGTSAPSKGLLAIGKSNDATAQYQPIPEGAGGRSVIIEGYSGGTAVPVSGTFWQATQPVSVASLPTLPAHQSTNVDQWNGATVDTNSGNKSAGTIRVVLATDQPSLSNALAVSQSGSWSVTANAGTNLNTSALALDTSVNGILLAQASTTSGQKGPLIQGAVTTAAPTYTTAQTSPLSLDTSGLLRMSLKDTPSNTNNLNVALAASSATVTVSASGNFNNAAVSATGSAVPASASYIGANKSGNLTGLSLDGSGNLNVNVAAGSSGNAAASATGSAVPANADYTGINVAGTLRGQTGVNPSGSIYAGQIDLSSIAGTTADTNSGNKSAGTLRVVLATDQPALTNALSVAQSGTWNINNVSGTVSLPTGAATSAKQPALGTAGSASSDVLTVQGIASMTPLTVSGTITANQGGNWTVQPGNTQNSTAWLTQDAADGPVSAGAAASKSILGGLIYNSTAPAPTSGQQVALQADQAGNMRVFQGAASATLSAWNSGTAQNTTQTIFTNSGAPAVAIQLDQTTTLTAGAITFEVSYDGTNWGTIPSFDVLDPTSSTYAQISVPYTLQASTNKSFLLINSGWQGLRIKLSTAITGTGAVTPYYTLLPYNPAATIIALSPTAANFNVSAVQSGAWTVTANAGTNLNTSALALESGGNLATLAGGVSSSKYQVNVAQINGVAPSMGNGVSGTGVQRVTIASDSTGQIVLAAGSAVIGSLTANQSVNVAQVAGGTASNAGQTGAMQVGGAVATNNNVSSATYPLLIAGSDYGGTPKVQSLKVDSSGNAQVAVTNTPTVTANAGTNLNTSALALESGGNLATIAGAIISQGTALGTIKNLMVAGSVTTNAPSYTTGNINPLSLDASGLLRVSLKDTPSNTNNFNVALAASSATVTVTATNLQTNLNQIAGSAISTAASGIQKVGIVGNAGATLDSTIGAGTAPTNAIVTGAVYNSSAPVPTSGQAMALQVDQAGNVRAFPGIALTTLSAWNSGTAQNTTQTIFSNSGAAAVLVQLTQTSTITAGAITFEVSYDNSNWSTIPASCVLDPTSTTFAQISLPYTLQASTNKAILLNMNGAQGLRIKLSTAITGTGAVTPNYALLPMSPADTVVALSPTAANFNVTANQGGSWTVTANAGTNLNTSALALDTSVNGILLSQGSTTSGQKGPLVLGAVTTNAPSYTTAQSSPISLDTSGLLRASLKDTPSNTNNLNINLAASAATVTVTATNLQTNLNQIAGSAISTAASGTQKVGIVGNGAATLDSTVGAGTAPTNAIAVSGLYNSSAPAPTSGQAMALQLDQAGNIREFPGIALATLSAWNSSTSLNATQNIFTNSGAAAVLVQLTQTTTLTAGAVTFEVSYDNSNWSTIPANCVLDPTSTTFAQISLPYTVQANTNKAILLNMNGAQALRIKLSTQITGTGTVTPNYALLPLSPADTVIALSPTAANFNVTATDNITQIAGSSIATAASGIMKVGVTDGSGNVINSTSNALNVSAVQSGTWTMQPGNTANTTAWLVQNVAGTSGGSTPYHLLSAASNNATSLKASAGTLYGYSFSNTNASARWVKFYNKASAPAPATDTVVWAEQVPGNATVIAAFPEGMNFSTGIAFATVVNASDTDNTSVGASDLSIDIRYK